ncbi:hypothetical protein [Desulfosporosinus sp. OT]|uniref:hypothetical protein n=1 Tax=Desulfosporosinus sp. OT TaxID=913865 RepID=UPI000223AB3B|nr:hypothetical protein [Desulfosporosinus sp. OT]EGW36349.1 putative membrane protein [Desulfosporosinus sp. OT]
MRLIKIPLLALLLQGIPEQTAVVSLAFVIAGIPLKWKKILLIGTVLAVSAYIVRLFPIPFGFHTILLTVVLFISLTWLGKGDLGLSLIACLLSFLVLVTFEFVCLALLMSIIGVTPETLSNDSVVRIMIGEPHVLILFFSAFLLNKLQRKKLNNNEHKPL